MKKIKFAFGIHNHQPIGNFDFVFEEAYQKSYLPFLQVLKNHPSVKISIHFTGILIDWLEENHPDLLELIKDMTAKGQLEVMSGAYYEPIISVIPEEDQIGQINKLSERVRTLFDYDPKGMWLAERVWEPTLPTPLNRANIKYTILDDTHFKYAGLRDEDLTGYFLTEDMGNSVALFPINKMLRYTIPFQEPQKTIEVLREMADEEGNNLIVFADDGEKFGVWPNTYRHVYEDGWLENFFSVLEENSDWIELVHFSEALDSLKPVGNVYLPTASYAEMMQWALFPPTYKEYEKFEHILRDQNLLDHYGIFVRGGFWRNFMSKYPEVNIMHKKMLRLSRLLREHSIPEKEEYQKALDHLWAAQCNCPYWHGVFGGLYLSHLRYAIFNNLIDAEKILDKHRDLPKLEKTDFDIDGQEEILIETAVHDAYFKPDKGAILFEYDFKPAGKNLLDTMTRRPEGYHEKLKHAVFVGDYEQGNSGETASIHDLILTKERDLMSRLHYDLYERRSLIDHFLPLNCAIENFADGEFAELADFVNQPYDLENSQQNSVSTILDFRRKGELNLDGNRYEVELHKRVTVFHEKAEIQIDYELINHSSQLLNFLFAVEFNFGLQAGQAEDRYYYDENGRLNPSYLNSIGILPAAKMIGLKDEYLKIDVNLFSEQADAVWRLPVETISLSESGFERVYQSSAVLMVYKVELNEKFRFTVKQVVQSI
ncbi:MAG: DUF1926 domain-containing protein [Calditrichaeota bacterium]|nr:DUF1926 domain-containing protein [Calditrichota bacterium]